MKYSIVIVLSRIVLATPPLTSEHRMNPGVEDQFRMSVIQLEYSQVKASAER
jgi:hypothetical protein